jgi:hypothetical protein
MDSTAVPTKEIPGAADIVGQVKGKGGDDSNAICLKGPGIQVGVND